MSFGLKVFGWQVVYKGNSPYQAATLSITKQYLTNQSLNSYISTTDISLHNNYDTLVITL